MAYFISVLIGKVRDEMGDSVEHPPDFEEWIGISKALTC